MNPIEFAALLNGREYRNEITEAEEQQAEAAGLVVVFGASDDLVELRGAINDEVGAYDGTTLRICAEGLLPEWPADSDEGWSEDEAEDYFRRKAAGFKTIKAVWSPPATGMSWIYETDIPHATFDVMDDGELYCRGIVFSLADLGTSGSVSMTTTPEREALELGLDAAEEVLAARQRDLAGYPHKWRREQEAVDKLRAALAPEGAA